MFVHFNTDLYVNIINVNDSSICPRPAERSKTFLFSLFLVMEVRLLVTPMPTYNVLSRCGRVGAIHLQHGALVVAVAAVVVARVLAHRQAVQLDLQAVPLAAPQVALLLADRRQVDLLLVDLLLAAPRAALLPADRRQARPEIFRRIVITISDMFVKINLVDMAVLVAFFFLLIELNSSLIKFESE